MAPHSRFTRLSPSPDFEAGSGAVGVATVHEGNDLDDEALIDDAVDHAVVAAPGREQRGKGLTQRLADLARIMAEGSHDELKGALHNPRCSWGLNPPVSSRLRAM